VRFRAATPPKCFDFGGGRVSVPIFLAAGVEKRRVVEDAARQIGELAEELAVGVGAASATSGA